MYGDPNDPTADKLSWSRFMQIGWSKTVNWPPGLTKLEVEGRSSPDDPNFNGVEFSLWKPLYDDADLHVEEDPLNVKVRTIDGRKYICVDKTPLVKLVKPYPWGRGPGAWATKCIGVYRRWDPMNARIYVASGEAEGGHDQGNLRWLYDWDIKMFPRWGRPNSGYPGGSGRIEYHYGRPHEVNYKIPDGDLPSVGWLGEAFTHNCAQDGPLSWVTDEAQRPAEYDTVNNKWSYYPKNLIETAKLDLFRPWGKVHNLHLYDMFTVWDPMHDGIDNDRDGAVDEADTGYQAGDRLGPEIRVYGTIDVNHCASRILATLWPGERVPPVYVTQRYGVNTERAHSTHETWFDAHVSDPHDSIGDMLRMDDLTTRGGAWMGTFTNGGSRPPNVYKSSRNLTTGNYWGAGMYSRYDDDGDGITDERDERDFWFTQAANFMTTRSNTFTIEIVAQVAKAPYYPGRKFRRGAYRSDRIYAQKHLILLADRSSTLRIESNGRCDFTGPVRVLARRWGHERR